MDRKNMMVLILVVMFLFFAKSSLACFTIDGYTNDWPADAFADTDPVGDSPGDGAEDIASILIYDGTDIHGRTNLFVSIILASGPTDSAPNNYILCCKRKDGYN